MIYSEVSYAVFLALTLPYSFFAVLGNTVIVFLYFAIGSVHIQIEYTFFIFSKLSLAKMVLFCPDINLLR